MSSVKTVNCRFCFLSLIAFALCARLLIIVLSVLHCPTNWWAFLFNVRVHCNWNIIAIWEQHYWIVVIFAIVFNILTSDSSVATSVSGLASHCCRCLSRLTTVTADEATVGVPQHCPQASRKFSYLVLVNHRYFFHPEFLVSSALFCYRYNCCSLLLSFAVVLFVVRNKKFHWRVARLAI